MERTLDFQIRLVSPHDCVNLFLYNTVYILLYRLIPLIMVRAWSAIFQYINDIHINRITKALFGQCRNIRVHNIIDNINRDRT